MPLSDLENELVGLLRRIRERPGMYIGGPSLERLSGFISGFLHARLGPEVPDPRLLKRFSEWQRAHTGIDKEASWMQFIRFYSSDDRSAFEAFYRDFETFMSETRDHLGDSSAL